MRRVVVVLLASAFVVWGVVHVVDIKNRVNAPEFATVLTQLGPYHPGMSLRQVFESLPANADRSALTLLRSNIDAWAARWRLLESAKESLDISYFIVREDVFGAAFLGHLLKKANESVNIRLLFDSQGTLMSFTSPRGNDWLDTLSNIRNVRLKLFRPLLNRYTQAFLTMNPVALVASEHDKIVVVDHQRGIIGGRNISAEYFADPADMAKAFEDVDIILEGKMAAKRLTSAFEAQYRRDDAETVKREQLDITSYTEELLLAYRAMDSWLKGTVLDKESENRIKELRLSWSSDLEKFPRLRGALAKQTALPNIKAEARLLDSHTRLKMENDVIGQALSRLSRSATRQILIQSPYLVLSKEAVEMLATVGKRGVQITILTNSPISSDNALSQAFFLNQWPELLASVPNLRIFVSGHSNTVHTKLAVFDDQVALVGTYNLDPVSMEINSEIMAAIWSHDFALYAAERPRSLLKQGSPAVYEYRIKRDASGRAIRDADNKPIVIFGPSDHAEPGEWRRIQVYWATLRTAEKVAGFSPLF